MWVRYIYLPFCFFEILFFFIISVQPYSFTSSFPFVANQIWVVWMCLCSTNLTSLHTFENMCGDETSNSAKSARFKSVHFWSLTEEHANERFFFSNLNVQWNMNWCVETVRKSYYNNILNEIRRSEIKEIFDLSTFSCVLSK